MVTCFDDGGHFMFNCQIRKMLLLVTVLSGARAAHLAYSRFVRATRGGVTPVCLLLSSMNAYFVHYSN